MPEKKTAKSQITLPKAVNAQCNEVENFEVSTDGKCTILRPLQNSRADEVRTRLAQLAIDDEDVNAAISRAHQTP
jgi:hypothetical protein